jgi:hypothetical protein
MPAVVIVKVAVIAVNNVYFKLACVPVLWQFECPDQPLFLLSILVRPFHFLLFLHFFYCGHFHFFKAILYLAKTINLKMIKVRAVMIFHLPSPLHFYKPLLLYQLIINFLTAIALQIIKYFLVIKVCEVLTSHLEQLLHFL